LFSRIFVLSTNRFFALQAWYRFIRYYVAFFPLGISILEGAFAARIWDLTTFFTIGEKSNN
jgi:hypothetical protein